MPMKKIIKWLGILVASTLILILAAAIAIAFFFPVDMVKDLAVKELSKILHRDVKVEKASFSIFTGVKLEGISISNRSGYAKQHFVAADSMELHYDLWPLLSRKVVIKEIGLNKPDILIEKSSSGDTNYSDLLSNSKQPEKKNVASSEQSSKPPFELFVNSFFIKDGRIVYSDHGKGAKSSINNFNLSASGFESTFSRPINFRAASDINYEGKNVPVSLSGNIKMDIAGETVSITPLILSVAGENANASVSVSGFKSSQTVSLTINSEKISVDPIMSIFAGPQKKSEPADLTRTVDQLTSSIPKTLTVNASVNISNLTFAKFTVDRINLSMQLKDKIASLDLKEIKFYEGILSGKARADLNVSGLAYSAGNIKLSGFNAHPFSNSVIDAFLTNVPDLKDLRDKVYGKLDASASFTGKGVDPKYVIKNLAGDAKLSLMAGQIKKVKVLAAIGEAIKSNVLKNDIKVGELNVDAGIKSGIVNVRKLSFDQDDFKLGFTGGIDLARLTWVAGNRLAINLAPYIVKDLGREYSLLKDPSGWLELDFELTGSLKFPIPKPRFEKPIMKLKSKLKEKAAAIISEEKDKAQTVINNKVSEEAERLKKEAAEKIRSLFN